MIIAQISDTHMALDTREADQRIRDFELTVADINALDLQTMTDRRFKSVPIAIVDRDGVLPVKFKARNYPGPYLPR